MKLASLLRLPALTVFLSQLFLAPSTAVQAEATQSCPGPRSEMGLAYDAARRVVVLFGGTDMNGVGLNDTWTWDGAMWTHETPPRFPQRRESPMLAYTAVGKRVVMFGGLGPGGLRNETWTWNGSNWRLEHPTTPPPKRSDAGFAYDAPGGKWCCSPARARVASSTTIRGPGTVWNGSRRPPQTLRRVERRSP